MTPRGRLPVLLAPIASDDLDEAFVYVAEHNRTAASDLLDGVQAAVERLGEFPEMGVALPAEQYELLSPGVRVVTVEPYAVFYRVTPTAVVILRIMHMRRDALGEMLE